MMNLTIETKNEKTKSQIMAAYNKALKSSNIKSFVNKLNVATDETIIVGLSGSHIWISEKENGNRLAIITNLFN